MWGTPKLQFPPHSVGRGVGRADRTVWRKRELPTSVTHPVRTGERHSEDMGEGSLWVRGAQGETTRVGMTECKACRATEWTEATAWTRGVCSAD